LSFLLADYGYNA